MILFSLFTEQRLCQKKRDTLKYYPIEIGDFDPFEEQIIKRVPELDMSFNPSRRTQFRTGMESEYSGAATTSSDFNRQPHRRANTVSPHLPSMNKSIASQFLTIAELDKQPVIPTLAPRMLLKLGAQDKIFYPNVDGDYDVPGLICMVEPMTKLPINEHHMVDGVLFTLQQLPSKNNCSVQCFLVYIEEDGARKRLAIAIGRHPDYSLFTDRKTGCVDNLLEKNVFVYGDFQGRANMCRVDAYSRMINKMKKKVKVIDWNLYVLDKDIYNADNFHEGASMAYAHLQPSISLEYFGKLGDQ